MVSVDCLIEYEEPFFVKLMILVIAPVIAVLLLISWIFVYLVYRFRKVRIEHLLSKVLGSLTEVLLSSLLW
jgi:hypothetical protein